MKRNRFPKGWNELRVRKLLAHYEAQTENEAVAEDEAASHLRGQTVMIVPKGLVPEITRLIERRTPGRSSPSKPAKRLQRTAYR
jgi:hypothetical protein